MIELRSSLLETEKLVKKRTDEALQAKNKQRDAEKKASSMVDALSAQETQIEELKTEKEKCEASI